MQAHFMRSWLVVVFVTSHLVWPAVAQADNPPNNCSYPSAADRFGLSVYSDDEITAYNTEVLGAGRYMNWRADFTPLHPWHELHVYCARVSWGAVSVVKRFKSVGCG